MCYYSSISVGFKIIEDRFGARFVQTESFQPVYSASAFTFPALPVISNENPEQIVLMNWGLIPFWIKDASSALSIRQQTINARAETLLEKPAFRQAAAAKRCLVLVDGFFEWRHETGRTIPYFIRLVDHNPFALAGVWDSWLNPQTQQRMRSFAVITTRANSLLEFIHNTKKRMPVILPRDQEKVWLGKLDKSAIQSMLQPYRAEEMEAFPVTNLISKLGLNTTHPEVLKKIEENNKFYPDGLKGAK
jgi:putative SOS response-associated peptidase YedK